MSEQPPEAFAPAADLRRRLQRLGADAPSSSRDDVHEGAREARMAASVDRELEKLVKARRGGRRTLMGFAAVAALVAVTLGLRHGRFAASSLAILPEPTSSEKVAPIANGAEPEQTAPTPPSALPRASSRANTALSVGALPSAAASVGSQSTLAEENQLFRAAVESSRNGDVNGAVAQLDELLVEHPTSPLAQTALVRKFRLLAKAGRREEARREAERYLSRYPTGFAVQEAQALQAAGGGRNTP